jgi:hypothetical protein
MWTATVDNSMRMNKENFETLNEPHLTPNSYRVLLKTMRSKAETRGLIVTDVK